MRCLLAWGLDSDHMIPSPRTQIHNIDAKQIHNARCNVSMLCSTLTSPRITLLHWLSSVYRIFKWGVQYLYLLKYLESYSFSSSIESTWILFVASKNIDMWKDRAFLLIHPDTNSGLLHWIPLHAFNFPSMLLWLYVKYQSIYSFIASKSIDMWKYRASLLIHPDTNIGILHWTPL